MKALKRIQKWLYRYIPAMPQVCHIDIVSVCNLKCIMCPQSKGIQKRQPKMSMDIFTSIVDQVCECRPLIKLYMSGEPLLHDRLLDMIAYVSNKGCETMVHTNATLLTAEMSRELLQSKLTYLSFSFDGCSKEIYEKLRPPANFERVTANISDYLDLRCQSSVKGPHTTVEIIKMQDTKDLLNKFVAHWKDRGVDAVSVTNYMTWIGAVEDFRVTPPPNHGYKPCLAPFISCSFLSDGTVVPCCMDMNGALPLGNVASQPFADIWRSVKYGRLRKQLLTGAIPKGSICSGCYNTFYSSRKEMALMTVPHLFAKYRLNRASYGK